jgi:hypothetical protein
MREDRRDGHFLPVYLYKMETVLEEVLCDSYVGYFLSISYSGTLDTNALMLTPVLPRSPPTLAFDFL